MLARWRLPLSISIHHRLRLVLLLTCSRSLLAGIGFSYFHVELPERLASTTQNPKPNQSPSLTGAQSFQCYSDICEATTRCSLDRRGGHFGYLYLGCPWVAGSQAASQPEHIVIVIDDGIHFIRRHNCSGITPHRIGSLSKAESQTFPIWTYDNKEPDFNLAI